MLNMVELTWGGWVLLRIKLRASCTLGTYFTAELQPRSTTVHDPRRVNANFPGRTDSLWATGFYFLFSVYRCFACWAAV